MGSITSGFLIPANLGNSLMEFDGLVNLFRGTLWGKSAIALPQEPLAYCWRGNSLILEG
jgi:hypothetical protein